MVKNYVEKILTDPKLSAIKRYLENDHAIDVLLLNYLGMGKWGDTKKFMKEHNLPISDGTFRKRQKELVELGLAKEISIDWLKNRYEATGSGKKLAELLLGLYDSFEK